MRILQVCPRYPPQTGGVETHVEEISTRLATGGHDVTVHTADGWEDGERRERRNGVEVWRHRRLSPGGSFHIAPGIVTAVRQADADVVHAHNYHSLPLAFAAMGVTRERFVVTPHYHGGSASSVRDRLLSLYEPLGGWALRRADTVIAVSRWEREQLRTDFGIDARVVPNGISREDFTDVRPEVRGGPYLLCVGRLEEYKGVQYAIRALAELPEWELVVAGAGPYRSALETIAEESSVADRVSFLRYVDNERLAELYAGAGAFLALSDFEAYGMTVGEALAAGTPCVVHDAGALRAWIATDGCVGVERRTAEQLANAVSSVRDRTPDSTSLPSWDDVAEELLAVYGE